MIIINKEAKSAVEESQEYSIQKDSQSVAPEHAGLSDAVFTSTAAVFLSQGVRQFAAGPTSVQGACPKRCTTVVEALGGRLARFF